LAGDQGCYAEAGFHTRLHWDRLSRGESGSPAAAFIKQVLALPAGILFRHCVAGDQWPDPADPLRIDHGLLLQLARATRHLRAAWSFTHFPMGDGLLSLGIPVVDALPLGNCVALVLIGGLGTEA
jgi:hypothetical protein